MNISSSKRKKLALSLRRRNQVLTWREMAEKDYQNQIHYAVLCKIANTNGAYVPSDAKSQELLGLIVPRSPYAIMPRWWNRTPEALARFLHIRGRAKELSDNTRKAQKGHR